MLEREISRRQRSSKSTEASP